MDPPTYQHFLNIMVLAENLTNLYAGAPLLEGWHPLPYEILDPPLQKLQSCSHIHFQQFAL